MTGTEVCSPRRSTARNVTVWRGPSSAVPTAVRTTRPSGPVAVIQPLYQPRLNLPGSNVTGTAAVCPAGTVTRLDPNATASLFCSPVSTLRRLTARSSVTSASVPFV